MTSALRNGDPGRLITVGTHMEDLENDRMLGPVRRRGRWCDNDPARVPHLRRLVGGPDRRAPRALPGRDHRLVGRGGTGAVRGVRPPHIPPRQTPRICRWNEADAADYDARTSTLWKGGSIGALLWCYADYGADLFDHPPLDVATHERTFGLWRADQTPKPSVEQLAARRGRTCTEPVARRPWLDVTVEEFAADPPAASSSACTGATAPASADSG